jgi:hypothetical protein
MRGTNVAGGGGGWGRAGKAGRAGYRKKSKEKEISREVGHVSPDRR